MASSDGEGDVIGCFGLTEPDFGSNPGGMRTTAVKDGNEWVLNGTKCGSPTGASPMSPWFGRKQMTGSRVFVPTDTPGFSAPKMEGKFSLRASVTSELYLEDVRVPLDAMLPNVGAEGPLSCLSSARLGIAWGALGSAMAVYDEALNYAKERVQFSRPIAGYQMVQEKLVAMVSGITHGQLLCLHLGRLKEKGGLQHQHISLAKRDCVSMARDVARLGREILGANGIMYEYQAGRLMCNLETVYTYEGTHDIHTLILGRSVTGLNAFE